jgi:hypothetical protein
LQSENTLNRRSGFHKEVFVLQRPGQGQQTLCQPTTIEDAIAMMTRFSATAYERYYAGNPCLDHLLTLSKFNIFRAFVDNIQTLGMSIEHMGEDVFSPFSLALPNPYEKNIPASLCPTTTQRYIPHHPWLDCFPFPQMRDNLINAADSFDDCELCCDLMDPTNGDIGMLIWGDPWLPQNWEVTELFIQKWHWAIRGCSGILLSSNYWRSKRGLKPLNPAILLSTPIAP